MGRKIRFCLVYRDMWQSSGKYQPRVDQLKEIAPVIVKMGCFSRVETNGGAFEQVNLCMVRTLIRQCVSGQSRFARPASRLRCSSVR